MKKSVFAIILLIIILVSFAVTSYNGAIRSREAVTQAWSNVEVTYQMRSDKIPNLVETVKGYAKHESEVLENITRMRARFDEAETPEAYEAADRDLRLAINVAVEAYPELKSDQLYLGLMDELSGIENRIAVARRDFNEAATKYNQRIRTLPMSLFASLLGFEPAELFQAQAGTDTVPTVDFGV